MDILANRLKSLRKENKHTQSYVCENVFTDEEHLNHSIEKVLSNYENGKRKPSLKTLVRLADFYNVTTDYLLGLTDCKNEQIISIQKTTGLSEKAIAKLIDFNSNSSSYFSNGLNALLESQYAVNIFSALDYAMAVSNYSGEDLSTFKDILLSHLQKINDEIKGKGLLNLADPRNILAVFDYSPKSNAYNKAIDYFSRMFDEITQKGSDDNG